jgi:hypothetical protein
VAFSCAKAKDNEKKSSDSWSLAKAQAKLNAEPILWFVSFYNLAQVVICTYMCVEIILAVFSWSFTYLKEPSIYDLG